MSKVFEWCGYKWRPDMNGRLINSADPYFWFSDGPIRFLEDGVLELGLCYNPKEVTFCGRTYYCPIEVATMVSVEDFEFGTFSAEIKCPEGYSLWPSFWLSGSGNWPPEIDIMEAWSGNDRYFKLFIAQPPYIMPSWRTTTNVHYLDDNMEHSSVGTRNIPFCKSTKNPSLNFKEYSVFWSPDLIIFKVDGKEVRRVEGDVCNKLIENLKDPDKGYKMNAIFNVWCENPGYNEVKLIKPMLIKNFKYTAL